MDSETHLQRPLPWKAHPDCTELGHHYRLWVSSTPGTEASCASTWEFEQICRFSCNVFDYIFILYANLGYILYVLHFIMSYSLIYDMFSKSIIYINI